MSTVLIVVAGPPYGRLGTVASPFPDEQPADSTTAINAKAQRGQIVLVKAAQQV
jgi:hypothetical protein